MDLREVDGRRLALLLFHEDEQGEEHWAVAAGAARWDGSALVLDLGPGRAPFEVPEDALPRVRPVPEAARDTLEGADFFVTLSVGTLEPDSDPADHVKTGLRWPSLRRHGGPDPDQAT